MIKAPNSAGTNSANCAKLLCSRSKNVIRLLRVHRAASARARLPPTTDGGSIARPSLHIEDGTPMAFRADEPFTPAGIPEAERPTADRPGGERDPASWTRWRLSGRNRRPDLALLVGCELGLIRGHASATVTTTFPNCLPECSRSKACFP